MRPPRALQRLSGERCYNGKVAELLDSVRPSSDLGYFLDYLLRLSVHRSRYFRYLSYTSLRVLCKIVFRH